MKVDNVSEVEGDSVIFAIADKLVQLLDSVGWGRRGWRDAFDHLHVEVSIARVERGSREDPLELLTVACRDSAG